MSSIVIQKISITDLAADAIVNAANEGLWPGGGVCGAIFAAAGRAQLDRACRDIGHCGTGSAVITPAFGLNARYIIHAVGPQWSGGHAGEAHLLYSAYQAALDLALRNGCHSIAFPLLSAGIYGYPAGQAWVQALSSCTDFLSAHPNAQMHIAFAVLDGHMMALGLKELERIQASAPLPANRLLVKGVPRPAVFFGPADGPNGCLSLSAPARFALGGKVFSSSGQYLAYAKCLRFGDRSAAEKVLETDDPAVQRAIGRGVPGFVKAVWDGQKQLIAQRALTAVFSQNAPLKRRLTDTKDAYLVACEQGDLEWSCGLDLRDEAAADLSRWPGKNLLGFALMAVRDALKSDGDAPRASRFLKDPPKQWGFRGDSHFWNYLTGVLDGYDAAISPDALEDVVRQEFKKLSGLELAADASPYVKAFDHGGSTGGHLSGKFWLDTALPLLRLRCAQAKT